MSIAPRPPGRLGRLKRRLLVWLDRTFRSPWAGVGVGVVVFLVLLGARSLGLLVSLELRVYDEYLRRADRLESRGEPQNDRIVLVEIEEPDIARFGHPIADEDLARVLENLSELSPRGIGVDLYRDRAVGEGRGELAAVAARHPNIGFIELLGRSQRERIEAPDFLAGRPQVAASNMLLDDDGVLRRAMIFLYDDDDQAHPSLAWWLVERYLQQEAEPIEAGPGNDDPKDPRLPIRLGRGEIWRFLENDGGYRGAPDGDYQVLLDFARGGRKFQTVGFGDAYDGKLPEALVKDRIVILGSTAPSVKDDFIVPVTSLQGGASVTKGIEIHGFVADQLLRVALAGARPTLVANETLESLWMLAWCVAWGWIGVRVRSPMGGFVAFSVGFLILAMSFPIFLLGYWVPVVPPALAWVGAWGLSAGVALVLERRARDILDRLLGSHVSEKVARKLWRESDELAIHGRLPAQAACITVLMTDLEGFTKSSERMQPSDLMTWLNEYMDVMVPIVERHDGLVDGYWGDAIKADFGAPEPRSEMAEIEADAVSAVRCALAMGEAMKTLVLGWKTAGKPAVRMRIGINTGNVVMGSQGSRERLKYTSMGDTVNVAARLEAVDKEGFESEADPLACRILVSDATRRHLGGRFELRDTGDHPLKGKGEAVRIFRVIAELPPGPANVVPPREEKRPG